MSCLESIKYRQCSDELKPDLWFVYREENGVNVLIEERQSEDAAQKLCSELRLDLVADYIKSVVSDRLIDLELIQTLLDTGDHFIEVVEKYFQQYMININELKPLKGECKNFNSQVRELTRPYFAITDTDQCALMEGGADFFLLNSKVVTIGLASSAGGDNSYALMPLNSESANALLAEQ
ncbi:hypothetical protein [Photobacterium leiognathi]|uniref:hypothetical protein n=1 Tax=Photobacterium leiognathi TaxID=553611 RepID=UPI002981BEC9|nr:hypothetical protein [Photobacterium leiognathi]